MAGSVDLANSAVVLPPLIVVDTNLVFELIVMSYGYSPHLVLNPRALDFHRRLRKNGVIGIVLPATYTELTHLLVKVEYQSVLKRDRTVLSQRFGSLSSWIDLYKHDPSIQQRMRPGFMQLSRMMAACHLFLLDPGRLQPLTFGRSYDEELIHLMCEYGLDSGDALMLMEAQRAPVLEVATLDADLLRAQRDFTIYTWL